MSKQINFCLFFTSLTILFVSSKGVNIIGIETELADYLRNKVFEKINFYRTKHGMNPLKISEEMINDAQKSANALVTSSEFKHSPENNDYGENIAKIPKMPNIGETVVNLWYYGIADVKVNNDVRQFFTNTNLGTMTQLLWKRSTEMGVGVSQDGEKYFYVVAKFNPKGNVENEYTENLPRFKQEDVVEGIHELKSYYFTKKSMSISNLKMGFVAFSELKNLKATAEQEFPQEYKSKPYKESVGFKDADAIRVRKRVLEKTNLYRQRHNIFSLVINNELNSLAKDLSNNMATMSNLDISNNINTSVYGINKFRSTPIIFDDFGELAVTFWYNQFRLAHKDMQVNETGNRYSINNLTQLLWISTMLMGVGVSRGPDDWYYVVVIYQPTGNLSNRYLANLPNFGNVDIDGAKKNHDKLNKIIEQANTVVNVL